MKQSFDPRTLPRDTAFGDAIFAALMASVEAKSPIGRTLTVNDKMKEPNATTELGSILHGNGAQRRNP
jgi:hypothetical protein